MSLASLGGAGCLGEGLEDDGHAPFLRKPGAPAQPSLLKRAGENEGTNPQDRAEEEPPPPPPWELGRQRRRQLQATRACQNFWLLIRNASGFTLGF